MKEPPLLGTIDSPHITELTLKNTLKKAMSLSILSRMMHAYDEVNSNICFINNLHLS